MENDTYFTKRSGWAKKSAYISKSDFLSKINVGRTTLVKSIPSLTCDKRWVIILPCFSNEPTER